MRAMNRDDLDTFARLHRQNPNVTSAFDVAVAMLLYRQQLPGGTKTPEVRPKDLSARIGIGYDNARKVLKRAADALESPERSSMQPVEGLPVEGLPTGRGSTGRGSTAKPVEGLPVPPHPPYKDQERVIPLYRGGVAESAAGSCGDDEPFHSPDPGPVLPGPPGANSAEAHALAAWAERLGNGDDGEPIARVARDLCNHYRADWIELVLSRKGQWGERLSRRVITTVLRAWEQRGEPEPRFTAAPPVRNDPPRAAPRGRLDEQRERNRRAIAEAEAREREQATNRGTSR